MDCRNCGAANPDEAEVCKACGAELVKDAPAPARKKNSDTLMSMLVVGVVCLVTIGGLMGFLAMARERARRTKCASNLKCMGYALHLYSGDFGGTFPAYGHAPCTPEFGPTPEPDLDAAMVGLGLLYPCYIPDGKVFECPTALSAKIMVQSYHLGDVTKFVASNSDYGYDPLHISTHAPTVAVMADQPAEVGAHGNSPNHAGVGQNVLYIGSNVSWSTTPYDGHEADDIYTAGYKGPPGYDPIDNRTLHSYILGEAP